MKKSFKDFVCILLIAFIGFGLLPLSYNTLAAEKDSGCTIYSRSFERRIDYFTSNTDSSEYNPELANMTAALSKAVYNENDITNAYISLGFEEDDFVYYDYDGALEPYKCCHAIGFKKSDYGNETVCLVTVRGTMGNILSSDWLGNYTITTTDDGKHKGFSNSADYLYSRIKGMIKERNITGKIKYVITGHSRGGAIADLLSVKLMENGIKASDVYNYNFAVPNVARRVGFTPYANIFNLCNREDPVPFLPDNLDGIFDGEGEIWGKFGNTFWFSEEDEDTINPLYNHDMGLYLEFFDQQTDPDEWDDESEDGILNIEKGLAVRISDEVNIVVTDGVGKQIAAVTNGEVKYQNGYLGDVMIVTEGSSRVIYLKGDMSFNIAIIGTKQCTVSYTVEKYNYITSEVVESKRFTNISMKKDKELYSSVRADKRLSDVKLYVVEDYNGARINVYDVNEDGTEKEIRHIYKTAVVLPTCTEKGYTLYTCLNCEGSYRDLFVEENGHSFDGSACTVCGYDRADECKHLCHKTGFLGFIWKIILFFCNLLNLDPVCDCGMAHY